MGQAISMAVREQFIRLKDQGCSLSVISEQLGLRYGTACKLSAQFKAEGSLCLHYQHCGPKHVKSNLLVVRASRWLRRLHPSWGAPFIRLQLVRRYGAQGVPKARTLQRWFRRWKLTKPRQRLNQPSIGSQQPCIISGRWMPRKTLRSWMARPLVTSVSPMNTPERVLPPWFFPHRYIRQVPVAEVREKLIAVFERWGKPGAMRVDNGAPFGDPTLMTTPALSLWLIAVDIDMIWNKPHCPEQNGQVEKMQDTTQRWAEVGKAAGPQHLQKKLDEALGLQRESYPVERLRHQTRLQAFPALEISRRPYVPSDFAVSRVYAFLCRKIYIRKVAANGQIGHYGQLYYLGCALRHQWVQVRLSTDGAHWQVFTTDKLIKELPATHLTEERIQNLTVGQRTNSIS